MITVVNDATPTTLPADGKSTAKVSLGISNTTNLSVARPGPLHRRRAVGKGTVRHAQPADKTTNNNGNADITYTTSTSNVSC